MPTRLEFAPLPADGGTIYLQQLTAPPAADALNVLTIPVPVGETDVMVGLIDGVGVRAFEQENGWQWLEFFSWLLFMLVLAVFAIQVLAKISTGTIDIRHLISEGPGGKASLARFQALIFTFVFMIGVMLIIVRTGEFPQEIPLEVLAILGASLGTYLVSKGLTGAAGTSATDRKAAEGPLLRYAPPNPPPTPATDLPIKTDAVATSAGPFTVAIPTTMAGPNPFTPVAVAVGANRLTLAYEEPSGGLKSARVRYAGADGVLKSEALESGATIATPAGRITEVAVQFQSTADSGVVRLTVT